ncbi:MAG: hypothetical protein ACOVO9_08645 [Bacteroidia bacterium]
MRKIIYIILLLGISNNYLFSQTKTVLDSKALGLFCHDQFDLGEYGFVLMFNKFKEDVAGTTNLSNVQQNFFYYSKDLQKKATFKMNAIGEITMYANKNYILIIDRDANIYNIKLYDYIGREWASKKLDLTKYGLTQALIEKITLAPNNHFLAEVYDPRGELHLFDYDLLSKDDLGLIELDFPIPSSNPFLNMKSKGTWNFMTAYSGYYLFYKRGSNAEFEPTSLAYHLTFYDEQYSLFKELLIDNILQTGETLYGKEASVSINTSLQSFIVAAMIKKDNQPMLLVSNYGMNPNSSVLTLFWRQTFPLINNKKYHFTEEDGITMPLPPIIRNNGNRIEVSVVKTRVSIEEEAINQFVTFDAQGKNTFNQVQMGNYEQLNLDGFCVDNENLYSRIKSLQMNKLLKSYCEKTGSETMDIFYGDKAEEMVIIKDNALKQIIIYTFKGTAQ